ncbi:UvrD-helicase domain-containing protein [Streptomyces niveus]|uniref:ATP-dependent helicase n=1 Tax=Streptomyces niveus TaxID=193462 RepID=UPI0034387133
MNDFSPLTATERLCQLGPLDILVVAPAGCGKTQVLAERAASLVATKHVESPRKLLALTFSNKARDNLAERLKQVMPSRDRALVSVTNFHGLAGRLVRAHGAVLGIDPQIGFPERGTHERMRVAAGINYKVKSMRAKAEVANQALFAAKTGLWDDEEVLLRIADSRSREAVNYQQALQDANLMDYDDLLRYGALLLNDPRVARLYREHFSAVLVDEVQDLSPLQLGMVQAIGSGRTTYAGDLAQGIYGFAGARPKKVFDAIKESAPEIINLDLSYRSSPEVLAAVNALAREMGVAELRCARPESWQNTVTGVEFLVSEDEIDEAGTLLRDFQQTLAREPTVSIGVAARRFDRLTPLVKLLTTANVDYQNWYRPAYVPKISHVLQRHLQEATAYGPDSATQLAKLAQLCRHEIGTEDASSHDELSVALEALQEVLDEGASLVQAVLASRVVAADTDAPVSPGLHLLTGHAGKGQEFDVVYVVGLEEGHIPDFRCSTFEEFEEELRVLHVMASRAKSRLTFTRVENRYRTPTWYAAEVPSRWWSTLTGERP